jgi:hypothetical protein
MTASNGFCKRRKRNKRIFVRSNKYQLQNDTFKNIKRGWTKRTEGRKTDREKREGEKEKKVNIGK